MAETTMEESLKAKIRNIYYTGLAQGLHEVDGFDTFASSWYEELVTLFQETIEQAMPEYLEYDSVKFKLEPSDVAAIDTFKSNLLRAIGKKV